MEVNPAQQYENKLLVLYDSSPIVLFVFPCLCGRVRSVVVWALALARKGQYCFASVKLSHDLTRETEELDKSTHF